MGSNSTVDEHLTAVICVQLSGHPVYLCTDSHRGHWDCLACQCWCQFTHAHYTALPSVHALPVPATVRRALAALIALLWSSVGCGRWAGWWPW